MSQSSLPASLIANNKGLVFACRLDGNGRGMLQSWEELIDWADSPNPIWVHLDRSHSNAADWLRDQAGVDEVTVRALLELETRPRIIPVEDNRRVLWFG